VSTVSSTKTFLLGVGAQKAGTTWLYEYLSKHPSVDLGFCKEYHVFDALSAKGNGVFEARIRRGRQQIAELEKQFERGDDLLIPQKKGPSGTFQLLEFFYDYNRYFDYFARLYNRNHITLTGDITPSYSSLSEEVFQLIKDGFCERGVEVKVLFLMRDPVERFISSCRMRSDRSRRVIDQVRFDKILKTLYKTTNSQDRGRYDMTMQALERVFDPADLHYEFYERLFEVNSISKICKFLGVDPIEAQFETKVNESKGKMSVSDDVRRDVRSHFDPVYAFLYERYSKSFIDAIWKEYPHVG
jgi:hypothetical protein